MSTVTTQRAGHKNEFKVIAEPFLQGEGLPFADVLDAELIQRSFRQEACQLWGDQRIPHHR